MHQARCFCEHIPQIDVRTRLALVMHRRERQKVTATGPLALTALRNSELHIHGQIDVALDLRHLHGEVGDERRVLVLFPCEGARPLNRSLIEEDTRPITLVVPDGNWRQASRIPNRVPGLEHAARVVLPAGPSSRWGVRRETRPEGLATFEAIARAFGVLEGAAVQGQLEELFTRLVNATFAAKGVDPPE